MNVIEAIKSRRSVRAFLSQPVEPEKLEAVLEAAVRTPSWANTQPWEIFVAQGETLAKIKKGFLEKRAAQAAIDPEIPCPKQWTEAAKKRTQQLRPGMARDCGEAAEQFIALNHNMFNAPVVVFICMDKVLSEWSLYDIGAYSQSFMLAALEQGLGTIPAIQLVAYPDILRRELRIPDNLKVTIGIAVGYPDREHKINNFVSSRSPLSETVRFFS